MTVQAAIVRDAERQLASLREQAPALWNDRDDAQVMSALQRKELAFDAQLSATEIVRRCERRIGELVRQGQANGTVFAPGSNTRRDLLVDVQAGVPLTVAEAMGVKSTSTDAITDRASSAKSVLPSKHSKR